MGSKGRPYRSIDVDGWEVRVGKGDDENDRLSFELSEPGDLWLHVGGGTPGSHVVVSNPARQNVPESVVQRAAELAAWYSKARGQPRVEIHICRVADLRKRKGAPAGQVQLRAFRRLKVSPTPPAAAEGDDT